MPSSGGASTTGSTTRAGARLDIVRTRLPEVPPVLAEQVVGVIQRLRNEAGLIKPPGVAETLDGSRPRRARSRHPRSRSGRGLARLGRQVPRGRGAGAGHARARADAMTTPDLPQARAGRGVAAASPGPCGPPGCPSRQTGSGPSCSPQRGRPRRATARLLGRPRHADLVSGGRRALRPGLHGMVQRGAAQAGEARRAGGAARDPGSCSRTPRVVRVQSRARRWSVPARAARRSCGTAMSPP